MVYQRIIASLLSVIIGFTGSFIITNEKTKEESVQKGIAREIIRFHVIANSDSEEDQSLKLQVKDHVVTCLSELLQGAESKEETRNIINTNLGKIEEQAEQVLKEEGHSEKVKAYLTTCYYPVKKYGDYIFPAGEYEALRLEIGKAEGKNWWCIMYPNLCFVEGTYAIVDEQKAELLKDILTEEEFDAISCISEGKYKIKFKILETLRSLVDK